jgi:signal transduction histidine kinase
MEARNDRIRSITAPNESTADEPAGGPAVATSIIYDFRDPLATIRADSEMLVRPGLSEVQIQRIARNVHGASVRMLELLEELQDQCRGMEAARDNATSSS